MNKCLPLKPKEKWIALKELDQDEIKEGDIIFSMHQSSFPLTSGKLRNTVSGKYLVLKVDRSKWVTTIAKCVVLYSFRKENPGSLVDLDLARLAHSKYLKWGVEV